MYLLLSICIFVKSELLFYFLRAKILKCLLKEASPEEVSSEHPHFAAESQEASLSGSWDFYIWILRSVMNITFLSSLFYVPSISEVTDLGLR